MSEPRFGTPEWCADTEVDPPNKTDIPGMCKKHGFVSSIRPGGEVQHRDCPFCRISALEAENERLRDEIVRLTGRTVEAFVLARLETEMIDSSLPPDLHDQALAVIAELRKNRRDLGGGKIAALKSRSEGRVEAVQALAIAEAMALADEWKGRADDCGRLARAVLAAADGREK